MNKLLLQVCKRIEAVNPGCIAYAFRDDKWLFVAVDDYEFYMHSQELRKIKNTWRKIFAAKKQNLIFCYRKPNEKLLNDLLQANNLVMNI